MKKQEVMEKLRHYKNATLIRICWHRNIENKASQKQGICVEKTTEATLRLGIKYSNIKAVQIKKALDRENNKKKRTPWSRALNEYIIEHIQDPKKQYLKTFSSHNERRKNTYTINGIKATEQEVIASGFCNASIFDDSPSETYVISLENLIRIGK